MAAQIQLDQAAKPAGTPGQAREDLDIGTNVTATAIGGPFAQHQWTIVDKPVDIPGAAQSAALLSAASASATDVTPVDTPGTYKLRLEVDSGSGLGALADDVAEITFYANQLAATIRGPLATDPAELPRRRPAFGERTEHNVNGPIFAGGNPRGWAQEEDRWFAVIERIYAGKAWAWGNIDVPPGGPAAVLASTAGRPHAFNVASVSRTGLGTVEVNFTRPMLEADSFWPEVWLLGTRGFALGAVVTTTQIIVETRTVADALADRAFGFRIHQNPFFSIL